jgi:hypothetical protein
MNSAGLIEPSAVLKNYRVSASECFAVQVNTLLVRPQHGACSAPGQQPLQGFRESAALKPESIVDQASAKAAPAPVREKPPVTVVDFRNGYKRAAKQGAPACGIFPGKFVSVESAEKQIGGGAFYAGSRVSNMQAAQLRQDFVCGVMQGNAWGHWDTAVRLPSGVYKERQYRGRNLHLCGLQRNGTAAKPW